MRLKRSFFNLDTNYVAQNLLGKTLVRVFPDGQKIKAVILETEAYHGFEDKASHASRGKTERNKIMFDKAGLVYVYLIYGMYWCFNVTTMRKDFPAAVLIRSVAVQNPKSKTQIAPNKISNTDTQNTKYKIPNTKQIIFRNKNYLLIEGPGRVCKVLGIDRDFYGEDLVKSKRIWIEDSTVGMRFPHPHDIIKSKRVGVDYAEECKDWEWNYRLVISN